MSGSRGLLAGRTSLQWSVIGSAGAWANASAVKAAVPGVIHVCQVLVGSFLAETAGNFGTWQLLDGAAILLEGEIGVPTGNGVTNIPPYDLNLPGTPGNSMSLTFAAVGGGTGIVYLGLVGYDR
jgi:hypothetical protein